MAVVHFYTSLDGAHNHDSQSLNPAGIPGLRIEKRSGIGNPKPSLYGTLILGTSFSA